MYSVCGGYLLIGSPVATEAFAITESGACGYYAIAKKSCDALQLAIINKLFYTIPTDFIHFMISEPVIAENISWEFDTRVDL